MSRRPALLTRTCPGSEHDPGAAVGSKVEDLAESVEGVAARLRRRCWSGPPGWRRPAMGAPEPRGLKGEMVFEGTAAHYAQWRPGYPQALFDLLVSELGLDGSGVLVDLGCGTGQLTVPFATHFERAVGIDPDGAMLAEADRAARGGGAENVEWVRSRAEDVDLREFRPRLVTIGRAFHWMAQDTVAAAVQNALRPDGALAVIGESAGGIWRGTEEWHRMVRDVICRWVGDERRAGAATYQEPKERYETILARRFPRVDVHSIPHRQRWTIDSLIGFLASTSYCGPHVLAERAGFEADLRDALRVGDYPAEFDEAADVRVILARP